MLFWGGNLYAQEPGILGVTIGKPILPCKESEGKTPCYHKGFQLNQVICYPEHGLGTLYVVVDPQNIATEISLHFDSTSKGDLVLNLLTGKFLKPHKTRRYTVTNRMGMPFDNIDAKWLIKDHIVSFSKRVSEVNKGILFLIHKDRLRDHEEKDKEEGKRIEEGILEERIMRNIA